MRPAFRDLLAALALGVISIIAPRLEPSYRDLWTILPLAVAAPLVVSGALLLMPWTWSKIAALLIHVPMALLCGLVVVLSVFLLFTILFVGTAVVLAPPAVLLLLNSAVTIRQLTKGLRAR